MPKGNGRTTPGSFASALSGQPWYVQSIALVGAPTLAAAFLIWWVTSTVTLRLGGIEALLQTQAKQSELVMQHMQSDASQNWALIGIVQRICINTAKTDDARTACTVGSLSAGLPR